jgi:hypothetical protein
LQRRDNEPGEMQVNANPCDPKQRNDAFQAFTDSTAIGPARA